MSKTFYLTTPLHHVSAVPHAGHAYTLILGDVIARYRRMSSGDVHVLAGTAEHGIRTERAARRRNLSPQELADEGSQRFKKAWKNLRLGYDQFIRTTEERHAEAVQRLFQTIKAKKFAYLGEYTGNYCANCESHADDQKICPDCGGPAESVTEAAYFFRLSAFQEKLLAFYQDNPEFVIPRTRSNEIISLVKGGLKDLVISRTSLAWGVKLPDDEKHVFSFWFDALTAYLSGAGYPDDKERFARCWPADVHLTGEDLLRYHAVYWPAFLMAAGLEPPRHILAHGCWSTNGEKMGEWSAGGVSAEELSELLPADYLKYFFLREVPLSGAGHFSSESLIARVNGDLHSDLGNLTGRVLKMIENYFQSVMPEPGELEGGDRALRRFTKETVQIYRENFDRFNFTRALDSVTELTSVANKYIVANEPWVLARDQSKRARLATILYHAAEASRIIVTMLAPIIPDSSAAFNRQLGFDLTVDSPESHKPNLLNWGELKPGSPLGGADPVFARVDSAALNSRRGAWRQQGEQENAREQVPPSPPGQSEQISIEDFAKVEMRVGRILAAERVPQSDKLLKLQVDIGTETRQLVAGIGKAYDPKTLPGRLVVVVTNLKPAKLMGVASNGMIVAASDGGVPVLATFTDPVVIGSRLK
jgi:methionyl-tRNA synthetase